MGGVEKGPKPGEVILRYLWGPGGARRRRLARYKCLASARASAARELGSTPDEVGPDWTSSGGDETIRVEVVHGCTAGQLFPAAVAEAEPGWLGDAPVEIDAGAPPMAAAGPAFDELAKRAFAWAAEALGRGGPFAPPGLRTAGAVSPRGGAPAGTYAAALMWQQDLATGEVRTAWAFEYKDGSCPEDAGDEAALWAARAMARTVSLLCFADGAAGESLAAGLSLAVVSPEATEPGPKTDGRLIRWCERRAQLAATALAAAARGYHAGRAEAGRREAP